MTQAPIRLVSHDRAPEPLRFKFTKRGLERIEPADRLRWVYDATFPGLVLGITPGGARTFYLAKRMDGRYRRVKIGRFPEVTVENARKAAARMTGDVANGRNPAEERRTARAATTFGVLFTHYLTSHAKLHKRTWREDERQYDRHLKRWAGRRLDSITRQDVAQLHARIGAKAPVAANRLLALLSKVFNTAEGMGYTGANPARGVQRFAERTRERFLDADELPRFLRAVDADESDIFRHYFKVLLFTGQRRENVASMRWDEIDPSRKVWTIPGDKFKTGAAVDVPLVPAAVEILEERKRLNAERTARANKRTGRNDAPSEYVFPNRRREANVPYLAEPKVAFDRVCKAAGIRGLRPHDLRRTLASWATMEGVPYPVVARMCGHKAHGVTSIYARFDLSAVRDGYERTVDAMLAAATKANGAGKGKKGGTR